MNVLLDACALIALTSSPKALPPRASAALAAASEAFVASVTLWEVAIKSKAGKLKLKKPPHVWFQEAAAHYSLREIPLRSAAACAAADLPLIHRDPFDRVIVAIALEQKLLVLTSDQIIPQYAGVTAIW
jgi:PIN domain nuclease of toxin-antitoxin system